MRPGNAAGVSGASAAKGSITGTLERVGGPYPGIVVPLPGRVVATSGSGHRFSETVGKNGRIKLAVPAGTYHLVGYSPQVRGVPCAGTHVVHVVAGKTAPRVDVTCDVP